MRKANEEERKKFILAHRQLFDNTDIKIEMLRRKIEKLERKIFKEVEPNRN